jgi:hypothetical protein
MNEKVNKLMLGYFIMVQNDFISIHILRPEYKEIDTGKKKNCISNSALLLFSWENHKNNIIAH